MSVSPEFNEALHPRDKGKFTTKPQSAGTTVLTAPAAPAAGRTPILATATLQEWEGDEAVTVEEVQFDASSILAGMSADQRAGLGEGAGDQDEIFEKAMATGLIPRHGGPFEVDVREALDEALETNPGYFDEPATASTAEDFDRSLPQFEGWPESLAEPKLDYSVDSDGSVQTKLTAEGQGELGFYSNDSAAEFGYEHFQGNFDVDEEVLEQVVEWASAKHLKIERAVMAEMQTAAAAARGRILAGAGMKVPAPTDEELQDLTMQTGYIVSKAKETSELASTALVARHILAENPEATHAEILVDEVDDGEVVTGVAILDANRDTIAEYSSDWDMDNESPVLDTLLNLEANPADSHWERYTSIDPTASHEDLQRNAYIIDLARAAAWTPGT